MIDSWCDRLTKSSGPPTTLSCNCQGGEDRSALPWLHSLPHFSQPARSDTKLHLCDTSEMRHNRQPSVCRPQPTRKSPQTAVHLAENCRKWPNLREVDYASSKSRDATGPTGGVVCPFGGLIGPMGGGLRPSMRTLTR